MVDPMPRPGIDRPGSPREPPIAARCARVLPEAVPAATGRPPSGAGAWPSIPVDARGGASPRSPGGGRRPTGASGFGHGAALAGGRAERYSTAGSAGRPASPPNGVVRARMAKSRRRARRPQPRDHRSAHPRTPRHRGCEGPCGPKHARAVHRLRLRHRLRAAARLPDRDPLHRLPGAAGPQLRPRSNAHALRPRDCEAPRRPAARLGGPGPRRRCRGAACRGRCAAPVRRPTRAASRPGTSG